MLQVMLPRFCGLAMFLTLENSYKLQERQIFKKILQLHVWHYN